MLTGETPVDPQRMRSAAWGQWQRMIVDEEPSRPSIKVSTTLKSNDDLAKQRSIEPEKLRRLLSGDIDWIVLKALEKDRSPRYATANQFADDVDRLLTNRPVLATPPSKRYLVKKFVRRHRNAVIFTSLLLISLITGLVATGFSAAWAFRERNAAILSQKAAERQTLQVRRLASLAGSPLLNKIEADKLAEQWGQDVEQMRQSVGNDDVDLVRLECQYVTWLIGHAMRNRDIDTLKRIGDRIQDLIPRTKRILTVKDGNFLSLLNEAIKLRVFIDSSAQDIVQLYEDMLPALEAVHGPEAVRSLMPEYATRLTMAKRDADAEKAIGRFLSEIKQRKLAEREWVILNQAVNDLAAWGVLHPNSYEPLRALRDTGRVLNLSLGAQDNNNTSDTELVEDLKAMQGTWSMSAEAVKLELVIRNDQADVVFFDVNGTVLRRDSARFSLSRSGAAKTLTRYGMNEIQSQGDAMIYFISGDAMVHAEGMLTGMQNQSMPRLRSWARKR